MTTDLDVHPGGTTLDLTADRFAALTAEVQRLQIELTWTQLALDDVSEDAVPINAPAMERLTAVAMAERLHTPRARHAESVARSGLLARLAHPLHLLGVSA